MSGDVKKEWYSLRQGWEELSGQKALLMRKRHRCENEKPETGNHKRASSLQALRTCGFLCNATASLAQPDESRDLRQLRCVLMFVTLFNMYKVVGI